MVDRYYNGSWGNINKCFEWSSEHQSATTARHLFAHMCFVISSDHKSDTQGPHFCVTWAVISGDLIVNHNTFEAPGVQLCIEMFSKFPV